MGGSPAPPKPPPPPPVIDDAAALAAAEKERKRNRLATGRGSTMLTGGIGLTSAAPVQQTKLLGQ